MRRIQIVIDQELDEELARQARAENVSKSALVRRYVGERLRPLPPLEEDPIWELCGIAEGDPTDSRSIDEIVYGA